MASSPSATGGQPNPERQTPISFYIYAGMFLLGLPQTFTSYEELKFPKGISSISTFQAVVALAFAGITLALLFAIYRDIDRLDIDEKSDEDYPNWAGSFWERFLRLLAMAALLLAVGELGPIIVKTLDTVASLLNWGRNDLWPALSQCVHTALRTLNGDTQYGHLPWGSLLAFLFIGLWNFFALCQRRRDCSNRLGKFSDVETLVSDFIITVRIFVYVIVALVCSLYWTLTISGVDEMGAVALAIIFIIAVVIALVLTEGWLREGLFEKPLLQLFNKVRYIHDRVPPPPPPTSDQQQESRPETATKQPEPSSIGECK